MDYRKIVFPGLSLLVLSVLIGCSTAPAPSLRENPGGGGGSTSSAPSGPAANASDAIQSLPDIQVQLPGSLSAQSLKLKKITYNILRTFR